MRHEIVMPQMGESITNGTITKWHKAAGDMVEIDETLLEISTDKVESEIPSPIAGKIVEIKYPEGETVDVGILIAVIDDDANATVGGSAPAPAASTPAPAATPSAPAAGSSTRSKRRHQEIIDFVFDKTKDNQRKKTKIK